jgi:hypothetical protein
LRLGEICRPTCAALVKCEDDCGLDGGRVGDVDVEFYVCGVGADVGGYLLQRGC